MILKAANFILFLLTLAILLSTKTEVHKPVPDKPSSGRTAVSFDEIIIDGSVRCKFRYEKDKGAEFISFLWGSEQARVAFDQHKYWFWIRAYDPKRHYQCDASNAEKNKMIPPLRPSFIKWIIGEGSQSEGTHRFKDGEYDVEIDFVNDRVVEQRYKRNGEIEAKVSVHAFQSSSGRHFPAIATLEIGGNRMEIRMGVADSSDPVPPNTEPPPWSKAHRMDF